MRETQFHVKWHKAKTPAAIFSGTLMLLSFITLFINGLSFGLDFVGGNQIDVHYTAAPELSTVRTQLEAAHLEGAVVQFFGSAHDVSIRLPPQKEMVGQQVTKATLAALSQGGTELSVTRAEYVGPSVGSDMVADGFAAMLLASLGILLYVSFRYQWRFAGGAVLALVHNVVITLGFLSFFKIEFDLTVVAALLTVIGFSLNDTVVVFDRMKENFIALRNATPWEAADNAINAMLVRTLVMSSTVLMVLVAMLVWGGPMLRSFSLALLFGVAFGTYASVYVATALAIKLGVNRMSLIPKKIEKEGADLPNRSERY